MKMSLLLQREPFGQIITKTLSGFFKNRYDKDFSVNWILKKHFQLDDFGSDIMLCNYNLNLIFCPKVNKNYLQPVKNEYGRSNRYWRTPLNYLYYKLATSNITSKVLASAFLEITPTLPNYKSIIIIPGNYHIRLLDFNANQCFVIHKYGFSETFFNNELKVRTKYDFLPAPHLYYISHENYWYSEELIIGTPLNRIKHGSLEATTKKLITQLIVRLLEVTEYKDNILHYTAKLMDAIALHVKNLSRFNNKQCTDILNISKEIYLIIDRLCLNRGRNISIAQTHGDFQFGNILKTKDGFCLTDWEYTDLRQAAYDALVFGLNSRAPKGLSKRIWQTIIYRDWPNLSFAYDWPFINWSNKIEKRLCLAIFLLEELALKLRENDNPYFKSADYHLHLFIEEITLSAHYIKEMAL